MQHITRRLTLWEKIVGEPIEVCIGKEISLTQESVIDKTFKSAQEAITYIVENIKKKWLEKEIL